MKGKEVCWAFFAIISCLFLLLNQTCLSSKMVQISKSYHPDSLRQFLLQCRKGGGGRGCVMVDTLPTGLHIQSKYSDAKTYTLTSGRAHTINKERCYASACSMSLVEGCWLFWWGYLFTRLLGPDPDPQCPDDTDLTCLHWQKVASLWKKTLTKANGIWRWGKKLSWSVSLTYPTDENWKVFCWVVWVISGQL